MICLLPGSRRSAASWVTLAVLVLLFFPLSSFAQIAPAATPHAYFIDCSSATAGDGSSAHPWNTLAAAQAHLFQPGDQIALARGTVCHSAFAPKGSGSEGKPIRLTAYGEGTRPRIIAPTTERQILLLFNQEYWQIDSLDLSGASKYGIFVSGDNGPLHHIYLKNLYIHDVQGGALKNKDNGLVVVGPSSAAAVFNDVLVDGVDAAHSNQWAGILIGGGNYAYAPDAPLNRKIEVRNSTVHDVYGDGIILFRDQDGRIKTSAAWQTGMQPTQEVGTPNAIWTWTCTDCTVEDNEAYLTDSPGVDGGAYDIDWDNTRNIVQRNYAHDTQGYCVAVFAAGYTTSESVVRDNLCIDNGLSPRLSPLQGAVYLHTWNDGPIKGLQFEGNTIQWNPPVSDAAAIVNDALVPGSPVVFRHNHIVSTASRIYRSNAQFDPSANTYSLAGAPVFTLGDLHDVSLATLQRAGKESESSVEYDPLPVSKPSSLTIEAYLDFDLDSDGLLASPVRAQLVALRDLAGQYGPDRLKVIVHLRSKNAPDLEANALRDLDDVYPGALQFDRFSANSSSGVIRLLVSSGKPLHEWHGFQNAATLGGSVRDYLGAPQYAHLQLSSPSEAKK
jgi:Right handed beta helix region